MIRSDAQFDSYSDLNGHDSNNVASSETSASRIQTFFLLWVLTRMSFLRTEMIFP